MNEQEWIAYAKENRENLVSLLKSYHPVMRQPGRRQGDYITAPNAENACTKVRKSIRENFEGDPVKQFNEALDSDNWSIINTLLNHAWFGVPESISCWDITGFREAVKLMEDLPNDDDEEEG